MRKLNTTVRISLLLLVACTGLSSNAQEPTLTAGKKALKSKSKTHVQIDFLAPETDWKLTCERVDILGWTSPVPVKIDGRNEETGFYRAVSGDKFKGGSRVRLEVQRPKRTAKTLNGECTLASVVAENSYQKSTTFEFP